MSKQMRQLNQDRGKPSPYYIRGCSDNASYIVGAHPCGRPRGGEEHLFTRMGAHPCGRPLWDALQCRFHSTWVFPSTPRATRKAHHPSTQPPSPLRNLGLGFRLRPLWALSVSFVFILLFFLIPLPTSARTVANTGRIYGQLLNGSKRSAPVAGQSVTLQIAQGENARDLTSVTTNAQGEFSFTGLNTDKTINYALYTLYKG